MVVCDLSGMGMPRLLIYNSGRRAFRGFAFPPYRKIRERHDSLA
jgi:hypothetical protein